MANWNLPTVNSNYLDFVAEINGKFNDAAAMAYVGATNIPVNTFRYNRSGFFEEWDSFSWGLRLVTVNGGGTGATNAAAARANLGIGSMGTQNANAVNITGGTIAGVTYSASDITTGIMPLARGGTGQSLAISPYGTTFVSDGTRLVLISGTYIGELDASHLVQGTVPLARLSGVATGIGPNQYTGANTFTANLAINQPLELFSTLPGINLTNTGGTVGKKRVRVAYYSDSFIVQKVDDAYTVAVDILNITWDGIVTCYGGGITNLNANNITIGTIATARLGSGTADSTTFLRGDGTWAVVSTGPGASPIPSGLIAMFNTACPAGWTRFTGFDGRFPTGGSVAGGTGGAASHSHSIGLNSSANGAHSHTYSGNISGAVGGTADGNVSGRVTGTANGSASGTTSNATNNAFPTSENNGNGTVMEHIDTRHTHTFNSAVVINVDLPFSTNASLPVTGSYNNSYTGTTNPVGDHSHQLNGRTADEATYPPYYTIVFCQKD